MPTKKKVLVIEDDAIFLSLFKGKIAKEGFTVLVAKDGASGLKTALAQHPDIILLDIIMPKLDGISVLKSLRADKWGRTVPVIMLTNLDEAETSSAIGGAAQAYLVKSSWKLADIIKILRNKLKITYEQD